MFSFHLSFALQLVLFGRDVSKIPCFRNSFLTGIYGGVGCGIASFLATSKYHTCTWVLFVFIWALYLSETYNSTYIYIFSSYLFVLCKQKMGSEIYFLQKLRLFFVQAVRRRRPTYRYCHLPSSHWATGSTVGDSGPRIDLS